MPDDRSHATKIDRPLPGPPTVPLDLPRGERRYLEIAQQLADQINAGHYATGEKLPPERDLSGQLGVSRTTVREALLALEIMRFIEIRVGAGVYVLPPHMRDRARADTIATTEIGPYELLEVRRVIEGQSASLAAWRATPEQLDRLAANIERMQAAIDDIPAFDTIDAEFHTLIAQASGNPLLEAYVADLWSARKGPLWNRWYDQTRTHENRRRSVQDHRDILSGMTSRRQDAAQAAMFHHIDILTNRFLDLKL